MSIEDIQSWCFRKSGNDIYLSINGEKTGQPVKKVSASTRGGYVLVRILYKIEYN